MKTLVFISDFFDNQLTGGAELNDGVLLSHLNQIESYEVRMINSQNVTPETLKSADIYILSNFTQLSEANKSLLLHTEYIIYEHDHKYIKTRDPSRFSEFKIPQNQLINEALYRNAKAVVVLSKVCKEIMEQNLDITHVHNIGTSLWSNDRLDYIQSLQDVPKNEKFAVIRSNNPIKGTAAAIQVCEQQGIDYDLIGPANPEEILSLLAQYTGFVFCPKVLETFSRISAEAKMLGCKLLTAPKMLGFASEDIYALKGEELLTQIRTRVQSALELFEELIEAPSKTQAESSDITVILNCYRRPEYLQEQIESIRSQTIAPTQIWVWVNHHEDNASFDFDSIDADRIIRNDFNWKFYGRFSAALLTQTTYVALFDDDTIPGPRWFENCLSTIKTHPGIMGGVGVLLNEDRYYGHTRVGWSNPNETVQEVDLVGHAWFMERTSVMDLWREVPYCWDNGEDIQLSYLAQKYSGTRTYVPPHPPGDLELYSSTKGMKYGVDDKATSRPTNHQVFYTERDDCVKNAILNGWNPIFRR